MMFIFMKKERTVIRRCNSWLDSAIKAREKSPLVSLLTGFAKTRNNEIDKGVAKTRSSKITIGILFAYQSKDKVA